MTLSVGGIDPRQNTFTVGVVDHHGVGIVCEASADSSGRLRRGDRPVRRPRR